jgi:hypothetical protein
VLGQNPRLLKSGRHSQEYYQALWDSLAQTGVCVTENWNRGKNGELFAQTQKISTVPDEHGAPLYYVSTFSDITALLAAKEAAQAATRYLGDSRCSLALVLTYYFQTN